jgi:peptidyl-tRNA hydrolase, PTH1 family
VGSARLGVFAVKSGSGLKIVVGLGNPGRQYAETRHNVGWMVLDRVADRGGWSGGRSRDAATTVYGKYRDLDLMLAKPQTFMNLSGIAVRKLLARQRVSLSEILVVVDDFALPLGRLRLRGEGSAGGHNGLKSIIGELGSQEFARLRVGIGEPPQRGAIDHVLSRFARAEKKTLDEVIEAAADAVEEWARLGTDKAANRWNAWRPTTTAEEATDQPTDEQPVADAEGVVRHKTGWRRLLRGGSAR